MNLGLSEILIFLCNLQLQEMLASHKTQPRVALALMWCAGPLPEENLLQGLKGEYYTVLSMYQKMVCQVCGVLSGPI